MREQKFHIYLDSQERTILLHSLVELKNQLLAQGRYADCVDELIFKVTGAPLKKLKVQTIDTNTYGKSEGRSGSYSTNYQISGRELLDASEVRMLDNRYALLFIRGERPVMDLKYDILKHPNVKLTTDGGQPPYLHGEPTKAVATIVFDSEIPEDAVKLEEVSTSYELLSEEDLEEFFNIHNQQNAVRWAELMAQYVGIQELTAENLNLLVERIEVYDRTEINAGAEQMIKICYRFGGYIGERVFSAKVLKHPCRKNACPLKERKGYGKISLVS